MICLGGGKPKSKVQIVGTYFTSIEVCYVLISIYYCILRNGIEVVMIQAYLSTCHLFMQRLKIDIANVVSNLFFASGPKWPLVHQFEDFKLKLQMESEANEHPPKQERLRTRWTASLDRIFSDLVVEQIQLGNRRNNVFDKKTWNHIRDEFNRQTDLNFNNNQLRKHLDVLRTRYHNIKSAAEQNEFAMDDSCCIGFDLWDTGVHLFPYLTYPLKILPLSSSNQVPTFLFGV